MYVFMQMKKRLYCFEQSENDNCLNGDFISSMIIADSKKSIAIPFDSNAYEFRMEMESFNFIGIGSSQISNNLYDMTLENICLHLKTAFRIFFRYW